MLGINQGNFGFVGICMSVFVYQESEPGFTGL